MNAYDFDNTIYKGDSTLDFWFFCMKKKPWIIIAFPYQFIFFVFYKLKIVGKKRFKEVFFCFLKLIPDVGNTVNSFWNKKQSNIKDWYLHQKKEDDLIVSASPSFLLAEICSKIGIRNLIATEVDIRTGKFMSENCYGAEKVKRFSLTYPNEKINMFFSDSLSDKYMAVLADEAFIVKGNQVTPWPNED